MPNKFMTLVGPFLGLLLVIALFGVLEPSFISSRNLMTVAIQTVIVGLGAIGMTFVIVSGGIDLSIGSVIALASVVTALVAREVFPPSAVEMLKGLPVVETLAGWLSFVARTLTGWSAPIIQGLSSCLDWCPFTPVLEWFGFLPIEAKVIDLTFISDDPQGFVVGVLIVIISGLSGVVAGALCGSINGWLVTRLSIVPFIVTLGMMGVARGVAKWLSAEQTVTPSPETSDALAALATKTATSPGIWITILLAVAMALVLKRTVFGTYTYALGSNEDTARLCGVPVERTKVWIYTLCGLFAGLGGVMSFARLSVGDPTTAIGKELDVIAAVVIGGASLSGGKGSILGSMVGALLIATLANGCNLTGVPNFVQEILIGSIIIAAVAVDRFRNKA